MQNCLHIQYICNNLSVCLVPDYVPVRIGDLRICMIFETPKLNLVVYLFAFMLIPEIPAPQNVLYSCSPILLYGVEVMKHTLTKHMVVDQH